MEHYPKQLHVQLQDQGKVDPIHVVNIIHVLVAIVHVRLIIPAKILHVDAAKDTHAEILVVDVTHIIAMIRMVIARQKLLQLLAQMQLLVRLVIILIVLL